MATQWKTVETSGAMDSYWPGKAADRTEGMFTTGTYLRKKEQRRPDGTEDHVWVLKGEDGKTIGVNSAAGLDRAMETITEGSMVRITFLGKKTNPKSGRQFNDFQVDVAETAEAKKKDETVDAQEEITNDNLDTIPF